MLLHDAAKLQFVGKDQAHVEIDAQGSNEIQPAALLFVFRHQQSLFIVLQLDFLAH